MKTNSAIMVICIGVHVRGTNVYKIRHLMINNNNKTLFKQSQIRECYPVHGCVYHALDKTNILILEEEEMTIIM